MIQDTTNLAPFKADRRHALILAAYETIAERGYEGLRVRDVAYQVGINGATLHYYFATKEILIQAVLTYAIQRLASIMLDLNGTPHQKMSQYMQRLQVMMHTEPELFLVLAETNLRAQHGLALNIVVQLEMEWQNQLAQILQDGVASGDWLPAMDPDLISKTLVTLIQGATMWLIARPDKAESAIKQIQTWLGLL